MRRFVASLCLVALIVVGCTVDADVANSDDSTANLAASSGDDWCETATAFERTLQLIGRVESGTPEELGEHFPGFVDDAARAAALAPPAIAVDVATIVDVSGYWEQQLAAVDWDVSVVDGDEALAEDFARAGIRVAEYNADACGIDNAYGTSVRADEIDTDAASTMDPADYAASIEAFVGAGYTPDEAKCLLDATESLDQMTSLLDTYGMCGLSIERLIDPSTG